MAIITSNRDKRIRQDTGIDTNLNAKQFHDLANARQGTTSQVNQLVKKYKLTAVPFILDATNKRKY